jgi:serine/threonine protein kinase/tetratricopeptide (TPR) repeat protein
LSDDVKQRARRLFQELVDLRESERPAALGRLCGDDASLRAEVEALLRASTSPTGDSAAPEARETLDASLREGMSADIGHLEEIGPYKVVQLIGEGGFGSVFIAEQTAPVQRKVALKVIKLGMDTRQVVARFEQERQALAMMDHPHIAKVLDAGATETGRPFFVMELVQGDPIIEYCDKNNMSIADRLELFVQVCNAVQHAHTKGIIHRDIKPSNVLISTQDGKPHSKVIDFGIAKATEGKLTEKTLFTAHRTMIGTPEYMSPEQAEGSLDIDTRTDVYSLGVLLYELLTGTTPLSSRELRSAAYAEIQRIIREVEPPRPSTRISQNADSIATVAAQRHTEPRKLDIIVRGELDWIVMRAMEKDRDRRYESPGGLALDIRRFLTGEAVSAVPPSPAYRLKKFVYRHKGIVTAITAVAIALLIGVVGFAWQARVALAAEAETQKRADELQKVADFQGQLLAQVDPTTAGVRLTEDVRARFDAALAKAGVPEDERIAQTEAFVNLWSRVNATDTALELIDTTILGPAVVAIDRQFADQPVVAATLRSVLAERYHDLGLDEEALALSQSALAERQRVLGADHPDTLISLGNVGTYLSALGRYSEAEDHYREALEKSRRVRGDDSPETLNCVANMGAGFRQQGKFSEAEGYYREALDGRRRVLGDSDPATLQSLNDWGMLLRDKGEFAEAEVVYRDVLAKRRSVLGEDHHETLGSINNLATLLEDQGKLDEAIAYFREVLAKRRRILGESHPATLVSMHNLGSTLNSAGQTEEADALLGEALAKRRQLLGADHPATLTALGNFSVLLINQGRMAEAEPICRETLERRRRVLGEDHPATVVAYNVMGLVLARQGNLAAAQPYWIEALDISRRTQGPEHPETLIYAHNLARLMWDMDKPAEAEELFRGLIAAGTSGVGAKHPTVLSASSNLGRLLLGQGRDADALEVLAAAEPAARETYVGNMAPSLGSVLAALGRAQEGVGQRVAAEASLLEANAIFVESRGPAHADTLGSIRRLVEFYTAWDRADRGKGHDAEAARWKNALDAGSN